MAEGILSALLRMVMEKATNHILRQFRSMRGIREKLEELERKLLAIQSMIGNAEERQGEIHVKRWLEALKETAYQADDILDEFNVDVMRRKAGNQADTTEKVRSFFSSYNPVWFRFQIGQKLNDIIKKINKIITEGHQFHFKETMQPQNRGRNQTHSYVDESTVIGREEDKEKLVKLLLDDHGNSQNVAVLPIVGMGGLGKTTLAQLIYKDERVEKHFQPLLIWVSVSDEFEVVKLAKAIITSATRTECDQSTMELLQHRLREILSGKMYLLVLDDVWNDDWQKWNGLKTLLETGKEGSKIIVTTRSEQVASMMGTLPSHYPQHLNEKDSWALFKKRAFQDTAQEPQNLASIGMDIVKKCDGLPLALNVLGALMHSKSQEAEWLSVKNSEIWNLPAGDKILSVLRLSYGDLPSHLKQCFAFCAMFPKDHVMEKEMLIQLWIANGYIPSDEGKELQDNGNEIFNELAWRSFFLDVKETEEFGKVLYWKTTCKMHDLMHDLAQSIMGSECLSSLEHVRWEHISKKTRHLYVPSDFQSDIQRTLNNFTNIRTLLKHGWSSTIIVTEDSLKSIPFRALKLQGANITQLLNAIRFLKHLRYLDLSYANIKALPEAISTLFNLQTLKLSYCSNLRKLPDGMKNMSNLRHLYINGCSNLQCMPTSMGQLKSLQTLTTYIVGNENGRRIDELNGLNLGGPLDLYNLKNVRNAADARKANLSSKHNLCSLILCWDMVHRNLSNYDGEDVAPLENVENAEEVLDGLGPHVGLKLLTIVGYGGASFPTWIKDSQLLHNLVEIRLEVCTGCEHLPPLWKSRSLKFLYLKKMDRVKHICSDYKSNDTVQAFPSLKKLVLHEMQSLKAWSEDEGTVEVTLVFPCLAELKISHCPNLMIMPELPSLTNLEMEGTKIQLGLMSSLTTLSSLSISIYNTSTKTQPPFSQEKISFRCFKSLKILNIKAFKEEDLTSLLEEEETRGLSTSLHHLTVENCNGLFLSSQQSSSPLRFWKNLVSLQSLKIFSCDDLVYWPKEEFRGLNSLKGMYICRCKNLIGPSPLSSSFPSSRDGQLLPNLEELVIQNCFDLLELPELPASLRKLYVGGCVKLNSLTKGLQHVTALEDISISNSGCLTSLPVDVGHLTALQSLRINNCPLLSSLSEGLQRLPNFQSLIIEGCPNLERWCKRGGPYWEMVSQIHDFKIISMRNTSNTFLPSFRCFKRASTI